MYHRHLVRVTDVEPKAVRVASSAGGVDEARVTEWVGTTRPPHAAGYLRGFFNRYMDPTEITDRFVSLAGEFSEPGRDRQPAEPHARLPAPGARP